MTESNGKSFSRTIVVAIITALCTAVITAMFTLSSGNGTRDSNIVALQTTVQNLKETMIANHDETVKSTAELETQLKQVQIDVARISQKLGVPASPGQK